MDDGLIAQAAQQDGQQPMLARQGDRLRAARAGLAVAPLAAQVLGEVEERYGGRVLVAELAHARETLFPERLGLAMGASHVVRVCQGVERACDRVCVLASSGRSERLIQ